MRTHIHKISKYAPSIFQGRLSFDATAHGVSLSIEHPTERLVLRVLCALLITLVCGYLYFVSASVLNVVARKEALTRIALVQGRIGGMEQEYFALSDSVSPQSGETLGLLPVKDTQYVYRPGNVGAVTIDRDAI